MAGPGPSTGYSPAAGAESIYSKDTSPLTVSSDSGPVVPTPLPSKMQRVSDVSGRTKAVASLSVKEKGISRAPLLWVEAEGKQVLPSARMRGMANPKLPSARMKA